MRSFYHFLVRSNRLDKNPFKGLSSPRKGRALPKVLSTDEAIRLLEAPVQMNMSEDQRYTGQGMEELCRRERSGDTGIIVQYGHAGE